jgi:ribonuclease E
MIEDASQQDAGEEVSDEQPAFEESGASRADESRDDKQPGRRRRRGRRGGRRGRDRRSSEGAIEATDANEPDDGDQPDFAEQSETVEQPEAAETDAGSQEQPEIGAAGGRRPSRRGGRTAGARATGSDASDVAASSNGQRPRRIWDAPSESNGDDDAAANGASPSSSAAEPEKHVEPALAAEAQPARSQPSRRRHETGSSEPRVERVVVRTGDSDGEGGESDAQTTPQRKGWWQRKFGGE